MTTSSIREVMSSRTRALAFAMATSIALAACGSTAPAAAGPTVSPATSAAPASAAGSSSATATTTSAAVTPTPSVATSSSTPVAATTPGPTPVTPTPAETPVPTAAATATPPPAATLSGNVDIPSLIPANIGGNKMVNEIGQADGFLGLWNDRKRAQDLLRSLGKSISDVSIVYSHGDGAVYPKNVYVTAFRVAGANGDALLHGMVDEYLRVIPEFVATPTTVGGKKTIVLAQPKTPDWARQIFYGYGDIVFLASSNPAEWGTEALTKLP